jgi:hypothetical protein
MNSPRAVAPRRCVVRESRPRRHRARDGRDEKAPANRGSLISRPKKASLTFGIVVNITLFGFHFWNVVPGIINLSRGVH